LKLLFRHRFRGPDGDDRLYELLEILPGPDELPACEGYDVQRARALAGELRSFCEAILASETRNRTTLR